MTVDERLENIETLLALLVGQRANLDFYDIEAFPESSGALHLPAANGADSAVSELRKKLSGRGAYPAWVISHDELLRYQREGLLHRGPECMRAEHEQAQ